MHTYLSCFPAVFTQLVYFCFSCFVKAFNKPHVKLQTCRMLQQLKAQCFYIICNTNRSNRNSCIYHQGLVGTIILLHVAVKNQAKSRAHLKQLPRICQSIEILFIGYRCRTNYRRLDQTSGTPAHRHTVPFLTFAEIGAQIELDLCQRRSSDIVLDQHNCSRRKSAQPTFTYNS